MKWVKRALLILLVLALPAILLGTFLTTQYGAKLAILLVSKAMPGTLSIEGLDGNLLGPFTLRNVNYRNTKMAIKISSISLTWHPEKLRDGMLHISKVSINKLDIKQLVKDDSKKPITLPKIDLPLDIRIDSASATNINFYPYSQLTPINLQRVLFTTRYFEKIIFVDTLALTAEHAQAVLMGRIQPLNNYSMNVSLNWQAQPPEYAKLKGTLALSGDLKRIELTHQSEAPLSAALQASIDQPLDVKHWQAMLRAQSINPALIHSHGPRGQLTVEIKAQGDRQQAQVSINASGDYQQKIFKMTANARADFQAAVWQIAQMQIALPSTNTRINSKGTIAADKSMQVNLRGSWENAVWPLVGTPRIESKQGRFTLEGTPSQYKIAINGDVLSTKLPPVRWSLQGQGSTQALKLTTLQANIKNSQLRAQGQIAWQPEFALDLDGRWKNFSWPLSGTALATSPEGKFHIGGTSKAYQFSLQGHVVAPNAPPSTWSINGQGDATSAQAAIKTALLEGNISSDIRFSWSPQIQWHASVQGKHLNPSVKWPDWPGQLGFMLQSNGQMDHGKLNASVDVTQLSGRLRDNPVSGNARIIAIGDRYELAPLVINLGTNHMVASGHINEQWNVGWIAEMPALASLFPNVAGNLNARGTLAGPRTMPRIMLTSTGNNIVSGAYRIGKFDGTANIDFRGAQETSAINIHATNLTANNKNEISTLRIDVKGQIQDHRFSVSADTPQGNIAMQAQGGLLEGAWTGTLQKGLAELPLGQWRLASPSDVYLSRQKLQVGLLCWNQTKNEGQLCAQADWSSEQGWQAEAQALNLPLSLLDPLLPPDTGLYGTIEANASITTVNHRTSANFKATSQAGSLIYRAGTAQAVALGYTNSTVTGQLEQGLLSVDFSIPLQENDEVVGTLAIDTRNEQQPLNGELHAQLTNFRILPVFFPALEETQGNLFADLQVFGSVKSPRVTGSIEVTSGSALLPQQGLALRDIRLQLRSQENGQFGLDASMHSGAGNLRLRGNIDLFTKKEFRADLSITGERFQALDITEYEIAVSPDLTISIAPYKIDINGSIAIPEAKIMPRKGKGTISASKDIIIEGETQGSQQRHWEINSLVRLELGEKVQFDGFGLTGRLIGNVVIIDAPEQLTKALGEIRIENGRYQAYGQDLNIERGRLLFVGGPIDDPGIDLRAVRKVEDVTAGLNVRGPLRTPIVSIFSVPAMSDQNALAYLLLGRPVSQASANEGLQLYKAAASLGFKGGELLAKQLGDRFGIDDVSLESGGEFTEPTLLIGKYLSPRLYIGYGIGLLNQLNSVRLRYRLSKMWTLEADSGRTTGADLLYTIEKN